MAVPDDHLILAISSMSSCKSSKSGRMEESRLTGSSSSVRLLQVALVEFAGQSCISSWGMVEEEQQTLDMKHWTLDIDH